MARFVMASNQRPVVRSQPLKTALTANSWVLITPYSLVINPQNRRRNQPDRGYGEPHGARLVSDFSEMMEQRSAKPPANQRADSNWQKCKSHVRALLAGWREP